MYENTIGWTSFLWFASRTETPDPEGLCPHASEIKILGYNRKTDQVAGIV